MKVDDFEIEFIYKYRKFIGRCSRFKVHKVPQIYVAVDLGDKYEQAFTLYEINEKNEPLFWYPVSEKHDPIIRKIAAAIIKMM